MRLATHMPYTDGFARGVERVIALEAVGLDMVWVPEVYGYDAATQLGYLAARTRRVQLGSGILPVYSRTPALLAMTAAGLDEVSDGRAILGLGTSGPQVIEGWHGVPFDRPVQRLREIIDICRAVWRREAIQHHGRAYELPLPPDQGSGLGKPLKMMTHPRRERIPIWLASLGERSVELAAEAAEGWLPIFYVPEQADAVWGAALRRGLATRPPELGRLEIAAGGPLAIGEGLEALREQMRPRLALYIGGMGARTKNFYNDLVRQYGYAREAEVIQELYLSGKRQAAMAAVPSGLIDSLSLVGSADFVKSRIAALQASGVTVLDVDPIGPDPIGDVARVRDWVA
jgi:F420-dependent oxidoreductase-like protein